MDSIDRGQCTRDAFFHGRLKILQPRKGYRFSLDSPILAGFLPPLPRADALEVGTGCGIVSLLGLSLHRFSRVFAVEIQPRLCALAKENSRLNGMEARMSVVCGDILHIHRQFSGISLAFSNPPFLPLGRGRLSPDPENRDARFETRITLEKLMNALGSVLDEEGVLCLVLPADREQELRRISDSAGFFPQRWRRVHSFSNGKPARFLVQLSRRRGVEVEEDPLVVFQSVGKYTAEMESILSGNDHDTENS